MRYSRARNLALFNKIASLKTSAFMGEDGNIDFGLNPNLPSSLLDDSSMVYMPPEERALAIIPRAQQDFPLAKYINPGTDLAVIPKQQDTALAKILNQGTAMAASRKKDEAINKVIAPIMAKIDQAAAAKQLLLGHDPSVGLPPNAGAGGGPDFDVSGLNFGGILDGMGGKIGKGLGIAALLAAAGYGGKKYYDSRQAGKALAAKRAREEEEARAALAAAQLSAEQRRKLMRNLGIGAAAAAGLGLGAYGYSRRNRD
jgi:hypothetical protein